MRAYSADIEDMLRSLRIMQAGGAAAISLLVTLCGQGSWSRSFELPFGDFDSIHISLVLSRGTVCYIVLVIR